MKKKLICLFLSLIMLLSVVLTSCGEKEKSEIDDKISNEASANAETLSMYLMSEEPVSADTEKRIEDAVNDITETKFKTRIDLRFCTEEEYYTKLEKAFADRANAKKQPVATPEEEEVKGGNQALIVYPEIEDYQVDLFYMGGMDRYNQYREDGLLANMDTHIATSAKKLAEYVSTQYFNALRANGGNVFALPSNRAIGQYTYLLFNKEALQRMYLTTSGVTSLTDAKCQEILARVMDSPTLRDDYVPLWTNVEDMESLIANLQFFGAAENGAYSEAFSLIGNFHSNSDDLTTSAPQHAMISNLLENKKFVDALRTLKMYETEGYYGTEADAGLDFAVGVVRGGAELAEIYGDDYEMVAIETPRMSTEDLYGHMFAVSAYSSNIERSMEILTYMNTNVEFRNLLLYGIEGEDYQLIDTKVAKNEFGETYKVVKRTSNNYVMAPEKTGNVFITYPVQTEDMIYAIHEYGVKQNKAAKNSLVLGFSLVYEEGGAYVNSEGMQALRALSAEILADYKAVTDAKDGFDAFLKASKDKFAANTAVTALITVSEEHIPDTCGGVCGSLLCYHKAWLKKNNVAMAA